MHIRKCPENEAYCGAFAFSDVTRKNLKLEHSGTYTSTRHDWYSSQLISQTIKVN
jgi:hypothetical protein